MGANLHMKKKRICLCLEGILSSMIVSGQRVLVNLGDMYYI